MKKNFLLLIISISFLLLLFGYFNIQILNFSQWNPKAENNSLRKIDIFAPRGIIYDSDNNILVENQTIYDLSIIPFDAKENFDFKTLSNIVNIPENEIRTRVDIIKFSNVTKFHPQIIKRNLDFETKSKIEEFRLDMPGIIFNDFPARAYQKKSRLTHVIGYLSDASNNRNNIEKYIDGDVYGISGIERVYEDELKGDNGIEYHVFDSYGIDQGQSDHIDSVKPIEGTSIYTTIDNDLQHHAEKLLDNRKGSIICMNPNNGDILTMVSGPDYDLKSFIGPVPIEIWQELANDSINKPLINKSIGEIYPPGSIYKIIAIAAALEEKKIHLEESVYCDGRYKYGNRFFSCWKEDGHGMVNMYDAIKFSCNIYFYELASENKIDFNKWYEVGSKFGFGKRTGVDLIGESQGNIPIDIPSYQKGQYLNYIIGQGDVLTTPLQIVSLMNILANNGIYNRPRINKNINTKEVYVGISSETIGQINNMIKRVVYENDGTAHVSHIEGYDIYGKTGTAENRGEPHSWFSGFIDVHGKKLSVVVIVENAGKGSEVAAPIAKSVFQFYIDKLL